MVRIKTIRLDEHRKDKRFLITKTGRGNTPLIKGAYTNKLITKGTQGTVPITKATNKNNDILIKR